ncbi:hypothetical protein ABW20_dc0104243 [Dactylellina cionopaga]|nr:hypothetical protein ABW20_dc0104243 [Dactylellina cionopaga]
MEVSVNSEFALNICKIGIRNPRRPQDISKESLKYNSSHIAHIIAMRKFIVILGFTVAFATAQTTVFGNGEHLCYLANDIISRCWTDQNVPATAAPLKECYCEWSADFDKDLIGCWEYIQTAVSFISPVETPGIPPYAGYCGPVTAPTSESHPTATLIPPTETTVIPPTTTSVETSAYVTASNPITYITPSSSNVSASNPITYITPSFSTKYYTFTFTKPHHNNTYTVYTLVPQTATTVVPTPSYVPDESKPVPPPPAVTGGASTKVFSGAVILGGIVAAAAFAF